MQIKKISLLVLFLSLFFSKSAFAITPFFEQFNNNYSYTNVWTVNNYLNRGTISFSEFPDNITLRSNSYNFPYIYSNDIFPPSGNFDVSFEFQYYQSGDQFGDGIVLSDNVPSFLSKPTYQNTIVQVWQDGTNHLNYAATLCPESTPTCSLTGGYYIIYKTDNADNLKHKINIKYYNNQYYYFVDNFLIYKSIITTRRPNAIWFGNPVTVGSAPGWYDFSIDYIKVTKLPDKVIDVPFFSQVDQSWKDEEYDHSILHGYNYTIGSSGCLISSAAMVLSKWGYTFDNSLNTTNPFNLNTFFKDTKNFNNKTALFWSGITEFQTQTKKANAFLYSKLPSFEMKTTSYSVDTLKSDIDNGYPDIVEVIQDDQGTTNQKDDDLHFVVAKGYDDNNIYIHDPLLKSASDSATLQDLYPNKEYRRMIRLVPSQTDQSYIWLHLLSNHEAIVTLNGQKTGVDSNNNEFNEIPNALYYDEGGIAGAPGYTVFELPQPTSGDYTLSISGDNTSNIKFNLATYNIESSQVRHDVDEVSDADGINNYILSFNHLSEVNNSTLTKIIDPTPTPIPSPTPSPTIVPTPISTPIPTPQPEINPFKKLRSYINLSYHNHEIKTKVYRDLLILKVDLAEFLYHFRAYRATEAMLNFIQSSVAKTHKNQISKSAANEIISLVEQLKEDLNL